jgi:hypothetical protein
LAYTFLADQSGDSIVERAPDLHRFDSLGEEKEDLTALLLSIATARILSLGRQPSGPSLFGSPAATLSFCTLIHVSQSVSLAIAEHDGPLAGDGDGSEGIRV